MRKSIYRFAGFIDAVMPDRFTSDVYLLLNRTYFDWWTFQDRKESIRRALTN